jgi:membrane protein implicated in regulation of membrane protease activity
MRPAKIVAIVIGVLLILISLGFLGSGVFLTWVGGHAESDGFLSVTENHLSTSGYALTSPDLNLNFGARSWLPGDGMVQIRATSSGTAPIFVGIAPSDQVAAYLSGVEHTEVTNLGWFSSVDMIPFEGGAPASPPGQQTFWVAQQEGSGTQTVRWNVQSGNWTAVLMNADGSASVSAGVGLGVRLGFLLPLGIGLTVAGVVFLAVGILLVVLGARRPRRPLQPGYPGGPAYGPPPMGQPPYGQYAPPPYQQPVGQPPAGAPPAAAPAAPGEAPGAPPVS